MDLLHGNLNCSASYFFPICERWDILPSDGIDVRHIMDRLRVLNLLLLRYG